MKNPAPEDISCFPSGYPEFLSMLQEQIRTARIRAALSVNRELVLLYWEIGRNILSRQNDAGWGAKIIDRLSSDLRQTFPEMKGFSPRNLKYMRAFASAYPEAEFVQQVAAQIPWFHNCVLLDRVTDAAERVWYIRKTIEHGWSRNILVHQVESSLFHRQGKPSTNFSHTLPLPQSDLAQQILKDPYCFDFLTLGVNAHERDVEQGLLKHVREFLLELGMGFAFVGNQVHLEVDGEDYYLDLLFYHLKLRCFVVIEIKMGDFRPEYAGKMNFYLSAVDESFRHPDDTPTIGLILCKTKSRMVVEYTLRNLNRPIGVSEFRIASELPALFQGNLPTIEQLEAELSKSDTE